MPSINHEAEFICTSCNGPTVILNVGRAHWEVCKACRLKERFGDNLFSGWRDETDEQWADNDRFLQGCQPFPRGTPSSRKVWIDFASRLSRGEIPDFPVDCLVRVEERGRLAMVVVLSGEHTPEEYAAVRALIRPPGTQVIEANSDDGFRVIVAEGGCESWLEATDDVRQLLATADACPHCHRGHGIVPYIDGHALAGYMALNPAEQAHVWLGQWSAGLGCPRELAEALRRAAEYLDGIPVNRTAAAAAPAVPISVPF